MPEIIGGVFAGAEQVGTHLLVCVDVVSVELAIEVMKTSFSGSEEEIIFQIPMSMKRDFERVRRHARSQKAV